MTCWELNRDCLHKNYPGLAGRLEAAVPAGKNGEAEWRGDPASITVEEAGDNRDMIILGRHVHSPRDPVREAQRLAASLPSGTGPVVVLGFGLGYGAEAVSRLMPGRPLVVVERHPSVLKRALEERDLREFLSARGIIFVTGENSGGITAALALLERSATGENGPAAPAILKNRTLADLNPSWYTRAEGVIRTWASRDEVNLATQRRFGRRWVRNLSRNMTAIRDLPGISGLAGLARPGPARPGPARDGAGKPGSKAIPVFLAAAGPSLDRVGPFLPEIAKRCIVTAVDTSLRFLLKRGTQADFVLVVDPQFWNCRHLDRCPSPRTRLVAESAVYPPVLEGTPPFRETYLCGSLFPLGRFMEDRVDPKGALGAGGSVATTAWDFARVLGAEEIWTAGLDLSFPGLKTHYRGAVFEEKNLAESTRLCPAETGAARALRDGAPFRTRSGNGGEVLTDRRLSLYAAWFENRFREYPGIRNYRLFSDGAAVEGLAGAEPEELLALPERRDEIEERLEAVCGGVLEAFRAPGESRKRAERYEKARASLLEGLRRIRDDAEKGTSAAENALKRRGDEGEILPVLDSINRKIAESDVKDVAGFLFPPGRELEAALKTAREDRYGRHLEYSSALYRALAEAAEYNLRILTDGRKKVEAEKAFSPQVPKKRSR
ncbi:MAG: DUF115 domain-containing protein [Treponema sp.]|jgi:hypothetical protein|nr:DUF115 domain-containing protein [Treponema sp.]